jgi:DNA-binding response OmpR family regulator
MVLERTRRILLVEDDEAAATMLAALLARHGYEVTVESRGTVALAVAAEQPFDLVILDVKLPDIEGYAFARELRKRHSHWAVPILMFTALGRPMDQLRGFACGADAYVAKPCEFSELLKTVEGLCGAASASA